MSFYLDTSIVVATLTAEARTADCQQWIDNQPSHRLAISEWVWVEFSAAIGSKARRNRLLEPLREATSASFETLLEGGMLLLGVTSVDFQDAADLARRSPVGVRGADALHLAIASRHGCPRRFARWTRSRPRPEYRWGYRPCSFRR